MAQASVTMATQTPSITRTSLRSSRSALPRFPVSLLDKTDQARIGDFSTNTTPSISNSHKADLPGSPSSSKTSISFFDGSGYLPSISNSPERPIYKMGRTKKTRASQQAEIPAPTPAPSESISEVQAIEQISRGKRKIKPTQKARELHDDANSKYYASLQTTKDAQTRAEDHSEQPDSTDKLEEAAAEDAVDSLIPSTRKRKRARSGQLQEHPAQTSLKRAEADIDQNQDANPTSEEDTDGYATRPRKTTKQEKPASPEANLFATEVEKPVIRRTPRKGKATADKGEEKPTDVSDAPVILGMDNGEELETSKPNTSAKPAKSQRKTRASSKTQKPKENPPQPAQQPLVTRNNTIITICLPSAVLRQFVQTLEITPVPAPPPAPPTTTDPSPPTSVSGLFGLDFPNLPCRLTCLTNADPSILALAVTTAIAEMVDPGAEHEEDEYFDQDDFEICLAQQCICNKTQQSANPSQIPVPVPVPQFGKSTHQPRKAKNSSVSSRRARDTTSETKQKDAQPQPTASPNKTQTQAQAQAQVPQTKAPIHHENGSINDEPDLERKPDEPDNAKSGSEKPRKKKKGLRAHAGTILDDGEGHVMVFTGHEWI